MDLEEAGAGQVTEARLKFEEQHIETKSLGQGQKSVITM